MTKELSNHIALNMMGINTYTFDMSNGRLCDRKLESGQLCQAPVTIIRDICEYLDKSDEKLFNELVVFYCRTEHDKNGKSQRIKLKHSSKEGDWLIGLEHEQHKFCYLNYDVNGVLKSAQINLEDYLSSIDASVGRLTYDFSSPTQTMEDEEHRIPPDRSRVRFTLLRVENSTFDFNKDIVDFVPAFYDDYPHLSKKSPQFIADKRARVNYQEEAIDFTVDWADPEKVTFISFNRETKALKRVSFPIVLPIAESNLLHEHLDRATFPLGKISWQVSDGTV